ncbi:MAG: transglutaminase family protein [Planctomycetales bacterium]|nr:transglutaminase family protein [Planctomycetales bacterium]
MTIRVALNHQTIYRYDRPISLGPQTIRLRPAAHCRTPIESYSLEITPKDHFLNWQQDPFGNYLARTVLEKKHTSFTVAVDLVANMTVINPFSFFLEPEATEYPFQYSAESIVELQPYLATATQGPVLQSFLDQVDFTPRRTIDFMVDLNRAVSQRVRYTIRLEPGVQTPEETLKLGSGSCRDSSWLLVQVLRHLGFAARFASGYLIQLTADQESLDGPSGPSADFTDLHAWAEVYLPGAGWVGLDPTSGLLAGEGHIPLACTPNPSSAAPITGMLDECEVEFEHKMSITRVHEDPRVTLPYSEPQWQKIQALGYEIDQHLERGDVRLTMGGEPTFVSIDDMDGDEWQTAAVGPTKRRFAYELLKRLRLRFGPGGVMHFGQGKWYPGEPLPRWAMTNYWRKDGEPIWHDDRYLANTDWDYGHTAEDARRFGQELAKALGVQPKHVIDAYEDAMYYMWRERRLPADVDVRDSKLESIEERQRIARIFETGLTATVGVVLPLRHIWWDDHAKWMSGDWVLRSSEMFLIPGDSPMGYRLPLESLKYFGREHAVNELYPHDPLAPREALPPLESLQGLSSERLSAYHTLHGNAQIAATETLVPRQQFAAVGQGSGAHGSGDGQIPTGDEHASTMLLTVDTPSSEISSVIRTALCIEPREGKLHVFLPPTDRLESFLDLVTAIESTATKLNLPVVIEGYQPGHDSRLQHIRVTPDPGVIEVNVHPATDWSSLHDITTGVYEDARQTRLGTEKFDLDGQHTGTGGGNHVVLGGSSPANSPWLRRPDLLRSFVSYWHNHPSLSYLFSGKFIGPTSQAPRADESRCDARYELSIACQQLAKSANTPPWLVDRIFRHLLVDLTGNTHRAEFCIDKLFSPDSSTGRLGLVEFRGFEMPPHPQMSLAQQLLLRGMVARFWEQPYVCELVNWDTSLHDRFMLPHFVKTDFADVIEDLQSAGFAFDEEWYAPHFEFRFPVIGEFARRNVQLELRKAIEPWYVLGEEATGSGTARFVDSSVERMQVIVRGVTNTRHTVTCNGRSLPLHPTGVEGEYVAGVRYRAWQPPSCLHPTIPVDVPLVFDIIDTWNERSIGGCQYHVGNPSGLNPSTFPINAFEAESRRAARFVAWGHTQGKVAKPVAERNADFPMTLDLRYASL